MLARLIEVKPSPIHGRGCFAGVDLHADIWIPIPFYEVKEENDHSLNFGDGKIRMPYAPYMFLNNGGENANCDIEFDGETVYLVTTGLVEAGQELTIDYGEDWC